MKRQGLEKTTHRGRATDPMISRRSAVSSSGLAVLGLLARSVVGQAENKATDAKKPKPQSFQEFQERTERQKAFTERMRNAGSMEERQQIMNERTAWQRQMAFERLKDQLRIPEQEWPVVKPRLQAVYNLVHPVDVIQMGNNGSPKAELEQSMRELSALIQSDKPDIDQIKGKLAAYRTAKGKADRELAAARQSLRQVMSLRQEAVLVLNGLLD